MWRASRSTQQQPRATMQHARDTSDVPRARFSYRQSQVLALDLYASSGIGPVCKFGHWTCMQVRALDLYASSGIGPVCKFGCMFHVWHEMRFLVRGLYDCMNMYGLYECDIPLSDINMVCWFLPARRGPRILFAELVRLPPSNVACPGRQPI